MATERPTSTSAQWGTADPAAQRLVPAWFARTHNVFPLRYTPRELVVASLTDTDLRLEADLAFASGRQIRFELATAEELAAAFAAGYDGARPESQADREDLSAPRLVPPVLSESLADDSPVAKLVSSLFDEALDLGASDLHVEPTTQGGIVRVRIDGVLQRFTTVPAGVYLRVVSRLKVKSGLDIAEHGRPQDGRASHRRASNGTAVELRISVIPARDGEKLVIRFLDPGNARALSELGLLPPEAAALGRLLDRRDGLVVITGPTGSGKTTTLYAALGEIDTHHVNVCTVEDPIEYRLEGASQVQVNLARGVTFASALRAFLRQDPDVILVGEIRDAETAEVAVQAASTGHLVLSTLHTNDAIGALPRLKDLGVSGSVLADALRGVVAQRLVRRLCAHCAVDATATPRDGDEVLYQRYRVRPVRSAIGCTHCRGSGYHGRIALVEVLEITGALAAAVRDGASLATIRQVTRHRGMRSLLDVARELVEQGLTTLDELHRVLGDSDLHAVLETVSEPRLVPASRLPTGAPPPAASERSSPDPVASDLRRQEPHGSPAPAPAVGSLRSDAPAVLIADHDELDLLEYERHFASQGWRVTTATDGEEALNALRRHPVHLAVLRLRLPRISGRELLSRLRQGGLPAIPVVMTTNLQAPELSARLLEDGADDFLQKPITPSELEQRCRAVLKRRYPNLAMP